MNGIDKIIARMEADTQAECADIAAQAAAVSLASEGRTMSRPGMAR